MTEPHERRRRKIGNGPHAPDAGDNGTSIAAEESALPSEPIRIPAMQIGVIELPIVGITPLLVNAFSHEAEEMMERQQTGKAQHKKPPKNPEQEFLRSLHVMASSPPVRVEKRADGQVVAVGEFGFPASAVKQMLVHGCRFTEGVKMTSARGSFHVLPTPGDPRLIKIESPPPTMRRDHVRVGRFGAKVADIRYRPEFPIGWEMTIRIRYNASAITPEGLAHLLNIGGFAAGLGNWRPQLEGGGSFGMFEIKK